MGGLSGLSIGQVYWRPSLYSHLLRVCRDEQIGVCVRLHSRGGLARLGGVRQERPPPLLLLLHPRRSSIPFSEGLDPDACHALATVPHTHTQKEREGGGGESWLGLTCLILPNGFSIQGLTP